MLPLRRTRCAIGLPLSERHHHTLRGSNQTVWQAVLRFIETPIEAAAKQRKDLVRLRRHPDCIEVVQTVASCCRDARCCRSFCRECGRVYRIWAASQVLAYAQMGVPAEMVVVLIKDVPFDELCHLNLKQAKDALRKTLARSGINACIGNFEVSANTVRKTWSFHAHLTVFGVTDTALEALGLRLSLPRAMSHDAIRDPVEQITYQFKFVTYYRYKSAKKPLPLPIDQLAELANWRLRHSFTDSLILLGFERRGSIVMGAAFEKLLADARRRGDGGDGGDARVKTLRRAASSLQTSVPHSR